jgi:FkbM family methyltransferase
MAYSQNDEEQVILGLMEKAKIHHGRFLDIGAYDGKTFSNTFRLVELGWSGVCIEPSPTAFTGLLRNHQNNPEVILVNAAIAPQEKWLEFYDSNGDALSTSSTQHVEVWSKGGVKYTKFMLKAIGMNELFTKFGSRYDFINLDVESLNWELFQALPWMWLDETSVICVEHDAYSKEMIEMATKYGFKKVTENGENLIFSTLTL